MGYGARTWLKACKSVGVDVSLCFPFLLKVDSCLTYFSISRQMLWKDVDADVLEETAKQLLKEINSRINSEVRSTDAFQGLVKSVKNFLSTCPLIMALRHPSMRPRHWTLLQVLLSFSVHVFA